MLIFLKVLMLALIGYHSIFNADMVVEKLNSSQQQYHFPYYSSSPYYALTSPTIENMPSHMKQAMMKSRRPIPSSYEKNLVDVDDIISTMYNDDTELKQRQEQQKRRKIRVMPFFFSVARSGGGTIENLLGQCLGLTLASSSSLHRKIDSSTNSIFYQNIFSTDSDAVLDNTTLHVQWYDSKIYVNVNLDTIKGIERATNLGLLQNIISPASGDGEFSTDVVISPLVFDISTILFHNESSVYQINNETQGIIQASLFTMFRHPVEQSVSYFYHLKRLGYIELFGNVEPMELMDWIQSDHIVDNVMVRSLVHKLDRSVQVTIDDLLTAKEIIRRKCIIGLLDSKAESWMRFRRLYEGHWNAIEKNRTIGSNTGRDQHCEDNLLGYDWPNRNKLRPVVDHQISWQNSSDDTNLNAWDVIGKEAYELLLEINELDMLLYEYAKYLFQEQGSKMA